MLCPELLIIFYDAHENNDGDDDDNDNNNRDRDNKAVFIPSKTRKHVASFAYPNNRTF